jgi:hypothetical protein
MTNADSHDSDEFSSLQCKICPPLSEFTSALIMLVLLQVGIEGQLHDFIVLHLVLKRIALDGLDRRRFQVCGVLLHKWFCGFVHLWTCGLLEEYRCMRSFIILSFGP